MRKLIVVSNPAHWSLDVEGVEVIDARQYLTQPAFARARGVRVFNLSHDYRYQSKGYYVSLLAEARGHKVVPDVKTIQDLKAPSIVRIVSEELDDLVQRSLRRIKSPEFVLSIYFGENVARQHGRLAKELFKLFRAPLMRARFVQRDGAWSLQRLRPIALSEIPEGHLPSVRDAARRYFSKKRYTGAPASPFVYDLAILVDPDEAAPPSNKAALERFARAAEKRGFSVEFITRDDYSRVGEFDALLLRATTNVNHYTYRFARRAQSEGIAVIDDPEAILRCTNKVYLAELLQAARLPAPPTMVVHAENRRQVAATLGLPCVLKLPDASFSQGVEKARTEAELDAALGRMLAASDLVIAQAYMPTDFDWRVGVLDGRPLYACKYFMAKGHWQIYNWQSAAEGDVVGTFETLPVEDAPPAVVEAALKAARLVGEGLFGVDVKVCGETAYVIEVNDNPSLDAGVEDAVLGEALYAEVIEALVRRIAARREGRKGG